MPVADLKDTISALEEMGELLELKGENPFKVRAFKNAGRTLMGQTIGAGTPVEDLLKIKGVGKGIAPLIHEMLSTGKIEELNEVRKEIPEGVREMLKLRGVGPSKVRAFWKDLEVTTVGELAYACRENRLVLLKGFGEKMQQKVLAAIGQYEKGLGRMLGPKARQQAQQVADFLKARGDVTQFQLCGSLRRCGATAKDADFVVVAKDAEKLMDDLTKQTFVKEVEVQGKTKTSFVTEEGLRVDVRAVREQEFPAAVQYFTGSKEHNTQLRGIAKKKGYKLNEYGLFKGEDAEALDGEAALYEKLGFHFIPPERREAMGEFDDYALDREPPRLVEVGDIRGVFHNHTNASDGAHTIEQMVEASLELGFSYLGISDHSQSSFYANGLSPERLLAQNEAIREAQKKYPDIVLFHGVECDIHADWSLDDADAVLAALDFVVGSIHGQFSLSREQQTERLVKALSHPHITMIGHPTGRLILGRDGYAMDMDAVLKAAAHHGKVMELNANPRRLDLDWTVLPRARELGVKVSINPDAHRMEGLSHFRHGVEQARKAGLTAADVFNTLEADDMKAVLSRHKKKGKVA